MEEAEFRQHPARESLVLVQPSAVRWLTLNPYERQNKARVLFRLQRQDYELPLTDPAYVGRLLRREVGDYHSAELGIPQDRKILFAISLGEPLRFAVNSSPFRQPSIHWTLDHLV